jgi:GMP synthase-like glutamine amidotransferase
MHIAVLDANTDTSAFARCHPSETDKFAALLGAIRPDWRFSEVKVTKDLLPAVVAEYDGYIVSGSPASVHDPDPWIGSLIAFIKTVAVGNVPIYGACFGHQAIASALGGTVAANPNGWEFGRVETVLTQPWDGATQTLSLYAAHNEQVVKLPDGARKTGETPGCENAAFAVGNKVWTTQYHPEMTPDFVVALVAEYSSKLPSDVVHRAQQSLDKSADEYTICRSIIAFFEAAT